MDMIFDIPNSADWNKFGQSRQQQVISTIKHENKTHLDYEYYVGDKVLIIFDRVCCKIEPRFR